jgi:hypothetical protein
MTTVVRVHGGLETLSCMTQSARDPRKPGAICSTAQIPGCVPSVEGLACANSNVLLRGSASLVISTCMPNPNQQTDDELLERAKRLAGQISDPKVVTIVSALLIAEAILFGSGRLT